jgi:heme/copper-type cytochrome/quinol oxidase subunit 2
MSLLWVIVILVVVNAATITAMLMVRRRAPEGSYFKDGDRASGVFGVLAGGFAIFAGFIIFLAFTTYDQSRSGGEAEALTAIQQFETAQLLPPGVRDRLTGEIVCYGRSVVHQEWPQMQDGKGGDTINPWSIALFRSLQLVNPKTASEQAAYGKWLDQTSDRESGRRDRLHGAEGIIPTSIWLVLFLIAGVVFTFMLFFADSGEGVPSQAMLMGSATTVIVLTLAAINALNHPYNAGVGQIKPVAMQRSLRILDTARTVLNVRAPVPCDARGARVSS